MFTDREAAAAALNMAYDAVGQLIKTVDAFGNATTVSYTPTTARFKTGMNDPDQGNWSYSYDALGQLKSQTDARGKTVTLAYDDLGRLISKSTPNFNVYWYYARTAAGSVCAYGLNRLCETQGGNSPATSREQFSYDTLGRAWRSTTTLDRAYVSDTTFDDLGRIQKVKYPTGLTVAYAYSAAGGSRTPGVLEKVYDNANASRVFWRIDTVTAGQVFNARGQLQQAQLGNGVALANDYDPASGKAFTLRATVAGNPTVLDQRYEYDKSDNVAKRTEGNTGVIETNGYDMLERLTSYQVASASDASAARTVTLKYNAIGNILAKSDVGSDGVGGYTYSTSTQPHAVQNAGGTTYTYDANGNVTSTTGAQTRTQTWTDFNLPDTLSLGSNSVSFLYDANYKRVKEVTTAGTTVRTLYLIHPDNAGGLGFEREETKVSGTLTKNESRHYIGVPGATIVVKTLNDAGAVSTDNTLTNYWHKDSLGSILAVSDASGAVQERMAFDAWGRRIRFTGKVDPTVDPANGNRGYTGHEHLDELGLIHMNARVMDPVLGRFLSPDTIVEAPNNLQSYNRYAYVFNNPLRYADPSGHCVWDGCALEVFVALAGYAATQMGNKYWQMAGSMAMAIAGSQLVEAGLGTALPNGMQGPILPSTFNVGGLGNSFLSAAGASLAATGDLGQSLQDGAFAAAFTIAGGIGKPLSPERLLSHALIACVQGSVSGGKCGPSALAAVVGKTMTESLPSNTDPFTRGVATALAGGTASVIGGGKFANGAYQAGFAYIFSQAMTGSQQREAVGRALTADEIAEARSVFGDKVDYERVRVIDSKFVFFQGAGYVMAPNGKVYWPGECGNLATCQGGQNVGTFIHEMTHVMQYQNGVNVLLRGFFLQTANFLSFGLYNSYSFTYDPSRSFKSYNIEQQGDIARDIYFGRHPNNIDY